MKNLEMLNEIYMKNVQKLIDSHDPIMCRMYKGKIGALEGLIRSKCNLGIDTQYCDEYTNEELDLISDLSRTAGEAIDEVMHIKGLYKKCPEEQRPLLSKRVGQIFVVKGYVDMKLQRLLR